jgi:phage I-like protein
MEMNFASKGVAGTGLGLAIGALGLEALRGNGLGGIFGNCANSSEKDIEIAYLRGRDAAKTDSLELYKYVDGRFRVVEAQIAQQAVVNAQVTANISCLQNSVAALSGLTKTVIPITNVCPEPMARYNAWTAPTTTDTAGG